jgi:hypothetical protein
MQTSSPQLRVHWRLPWDAHPPLQRLPQLRSLVWFLAQELPQLRAVLFVAPCARQRRCTRGWKKLGPQLRAAMFPHPSMKLSNLKLATLSPTTLDSNRRSNSTPTSQGVVL